MAFCCHGDVPPGICAPLDWERDVLGSTPDWQIVFHTVHFFGLNIVIL
jgi:hypothetical protein